MPKSDVKLPISGPDTGWWGRLKDLVSRLKLVHVAVVLAVGMLTLGISIGRFESKSAQVERDLSESRKDSRERIDKVEMVTKERIDTMENDVVRHLDTLTNEQRIATIESSRRMDALQDVLRELASDVAVLCAKAQGKGCAHR